MSKEGTVKMDVPLWPFSKIVLGVLFSMAYHFDEFR